MAAIAASTFYGKKKKNESFLEAERNLLQFVEGNPDLEVSNEEHNRE